jgi:hypothetical protein
MDRHFWVNRRRPGGCFRFWPRDPRRFGRIQGPQPTPQEEEPTVSPLSLTFRPGQVVDADFRLVRYVGPTASGEFEEWVAVYLPTGEPRTICVTSVPEGRPVWIPF